MTGPPLRRFAVPLLAAACWSAACGLLVEGGWSSAATPATDGTPAERADFFRRIAGMLDEVDAEA